MPSPETHAALEALFAELTDGPTRAGESFVLNSGDGGLLRALDLLSHEVASRSVNGGATIAAHVAHVRYGLSLMNRWASEGGNPFANALWDAAWKITDVDAAQWAESRAGLREEVRRWRTTLGAPRDLHRIELTGMIASIAHVAYHLGAIRQIAPEARGPTEGTFV